MSPAPPRATIVPASARPLILLVVCLFWQVGCSTPKPVPTSRPTQLPTYGELAKHYNQRLAQLDRLWSRAVVELRWRDERGRQFEQGDGNLLIVRPGNVALSVGKLGHTLFWAGSDGEQYWLFDLRDDPMMYFGEVTDQPLPASDRPGAPVMPVRPGSLLQLLGLVPLDESSASVVHWHQGHYAVEPPGTASRVLIDPNTWRPVRVELLGSDRAAYVAADLARYQPVPIPGVPPGAFPLTATRIEVRQLNEEGRMTLYLSGLSNGREDDKIKMRAFDLNHLTGAFKPTRWVNLDEPR